MWPFKKKPKSQYSPKVEAYLERNRRAEKAAQVFGRHYTEWVEPVKELKRQAKVDEAERILLACVDAVERETAINGYGVAPWYYEQLAILYRQQKRYADEVAILDRYVRHPLAVADKLADRLVKASELWSKAQGTLK